MDGPAFAQRVKALIAKRGMKIGAVMEAASLHPKFLSNFTKTDKPPRNGPTLESLTGIRDALGVSWNELLGDDNDSAPVQAYARDRPVGETLEQLDAEIAALEQTLSKRKRVRHELLALIGEPHR